MSITPAGSNGVSAFYSPTSASVGRPSATPTPHSSIESGAAAPDTVTLSASALAMASLNGHGVTVLEVAGKGLSSGEQPPTPAVNGSLSQSAFGAILSRFGIDSQQAKSDFSAMDSSENGTISNTELLDAMSQTATGSDALSQALRQMMDTNHDGHVSGSEFTGLETAFVDSEI